MKVILLDKVTKLGNLGDYVNVKSGYARNFLVPKGKAVLATKKNVEFFKMRRDELENKLIQFQAQAKARAIKINQLGRISFALKSGNEGKLFGSIGARDIANAITEAGIPVIKSEVRLPHGILRTTGEHNINIHVYSDIIATLNVVITPK